MTPIDPSTTIPSNLKTYLPNPQSPWMISSKLFSRISEQTYTPGGNDYKKCQVLPEDPECQFILTYFNHQKPAGYGISKIFCIHTPSLLTKFVANVEDIDKEAQTFKPQWDQENLKTQREQVIERWKSQANQFYPISIQRETRKDTYFKVRLLPLWHGTSGAVCHSIASTGFTYFGKHHFFSPDALPGTFKNTDPGYFGSGVYFSNSAKYSASYSSGNLLMAWVAMKEPFPVVNDVPHPKKGKDMNLLCGQGAYQAYDAHYIPVAPISPNPGCMEYYPCYQNQAPLCDEFVVFQKLQTLPRFWIELAVDFPTRLSPHSPIPGAFVLDLSSLPTTLTSGLSLLAKCTQNGCAKKDQNQWISLGLGNFDVSEIYYATACPACKVDFAAIDHFILHKAKYSIKGRRSDHTEVKILNQSLPAHESLMISHFDGWKYLKLTLN